jgi:predicted transcriptional regulator
MALEAGKHVLIENPITSDSRHAQELVELAASRELVLQVGHIFRFNSALRTAHQAIQSGMIGKVFYARVHWADDSPLFPDSDIIFGLGSHPIDVLNLLLDAWPSQASGFARAYRDSSDHGEVAFVTAQFPDAILAQIELSWLDPSKLREVSIVGSDGALVVDCLNQQVCQHRNGDSSELPVSGNNMIESEIDHFMDCIDRRITSPESGLIDVRTVQVLEAISESMLGQPLSTEQPANHTAAITEILEIASGAKRNSVWNIENGNAAFARYAGMLVRSGFLRPATAQEGKSYEITEAGAQFLREYRNIERDLDNLAERTRSDRYGSPAPRQRGRSDSAEF